MLEKGDLKIKENEGEWVKIIFNQYIKGFSYNEIATIMNNSNIVYSDEASIWNKNTVKRILDNEIYMGEGVYPGIISSDQYIQVKKIKEGKSPGAIQDSLPYLDSIREKTICYECGNKYMRLHDRRRSEKWYCKTNGCKSEIIPTDALIISAVIAITNAVIESPSLLEISDSESYHPNLDIIKLANEINHELDKKNFNYKQVKEIMLSCASKRYEQCKEITPKEVSRNLMMDFHNKTPIDEFDPNLFVDTVSRLLVEKTGRIHMQFINGATISYKQEIRKEQ